MFLLNYYVRCAARRVWCITLYIMRDCKNDDCNLLYQLLSFINYIFVGAAAVEEKIAWITRKKEILSVASYCS